MRRDFLLLSLTFALVLLHSSASTANAAGSLETFSLPAPAPGEGIFHGDIQANFPAVDWQTLDRLYLPAGHWKTILLGNLPDRTPERPLVITNRGGQVKVGGLGFESYVLLLLGGSNWVLTGRYDAAEETGDPQYQGHQVRYVNSQGTYGIFLDDAFETTNESGLAVGGGATDFEIEFLEITRVGFAGALIKTDDAGDAHMSNVRFHDNYIHDTGSEGVYFGSTQGGQQHKFPTLQFYNNRVLRAGTELVQLGQVGRGSEIHHNVFLMGALDWKSPFAAFQRNGGQLGVREGEVDIHHNLLIGGAASFFQLFPQPVAGDPHQAGDMVILRDNYFSHSRNFGAYLHAQSDQITEYRFENNFIRELNFQLDETDPTATDPNAIFITFNSESPMVFEGNSWAGPQDFLSGNIGSNITQSGNVNVAEIAPVAFMSSGFPADFDYSRVEIWTEVDTKGAPVPYQVGDYVLDSGQPGGGTLYRCLQANSNRPPALHPQFWRQTAPMPDDLRLHPDSPFQGFGLLDTVESIFADGFEAGNTTAWTATVP